MSSLFEETMTFQQNRTADRRRHPSRGMLSGEISWAFIAIALGWGGTGFFPFEDGYLVRILRENGFDNTWPLMTLTPSIWLFIVSTRELVANRARAWPVEKALWSIQLRFWASALLLLCWVYIAYAFSKMGLFGVLNVIAVGGACFALWSIWENRRVVREHS